MTLRRALALTAVVTAVGVGLTQTVPSVPVTLGPFLTACSLGAAGTLVLQWLPTSGAGRGRAHRLALSLGTVTIAAVSAVSVGVAVLLQPFAAYGLVDAVRCAGSVPLGFIGSADWSARVDVVSPPPFEWFGPDRATIELVEAPRGLRGRADVPGRGDRLVVQDLRTQDETDVVAFVTHRTDPPAVLVTLAGDDVRWLDHPCDDPRDRVLASAALLDTNATPRDAIEAWVLEQRVDGPTPIGDAVREAVARGRP